MPAALSWARAWATAWAASFAGGYRVWRGCWLAGLIQRSRAYVDADAASPHQLSADPRIDFRFVCEQATLAIRAQTRLASQGGL
jgi:hypothetical protein